MGLLSLWCFMMTPALASNSWLSRHSWWLQLTDRDYPQRVTAWNGLLPLFAGPRVEHPLDLGSRQGRTGSRRTGPDFDFSLPHPSTLISTCRHLIFTKSHVRIFNVFPPDCICVSQQRSVYWTGCFVNFLPLPPTTTVSHVNVTPTTLVVTLYRTFSLHSGKPVQRGKRGINL